MNDQNAIHGQEAPMLLYWRVIKKRRRFIFLFVLAAVISTMILSFFLTNIYSAKAVIMPVVSKETGGGSLASTLMQQVGDVPGLSVPESSSFSEIGTLLLSTILREEMITRNNLLPTLFPDEWDHKTKKWKTDMTLNPFRLMAKLNRRIQPEDNGSSKSDDTPTLWDGLRKLDKIITIRSNAKEKTITILAESENAAGAAYLVDCFLFALNDYMSREAKRVALTNRKYLEEQLLLTHDPYIKQKIYNMIAQQIETSMMAELKENYAFKILDRPKVADKKIKPKRFLMIMISLVASLLLSIFFVFFREYWQKIQTPAPE